MTQSVFLSVYFIRPGVVAPLRLISGVFKSPEELVLRSLEELRNLRPPTFTDGRIVINLFEKPRTPGKENPGILIRRDESIYDPLYLEAERFFDVE